MIRNILKESSISTGNILFFVALAFCYCVFYRMYGLGDDLLRYETITLGILFFSIFIISFALCNRAIGIKMKVVEDYYLTVLLFVVYLLFHLLFSKYFVISEVFTVISSLLISTTFIIIRTNYRINNYLAIAFFLIFFYLFFYYRIIESTTIALLNEEQHAQFFNSIYYLLCLIPFFLNYKVRYVFIIIALFCVLISGKVGAVIGLLLGLISFFLVNQKVKDQKLGKAFWAILIFSALLIYLYTRVASVLEFDILQKVEEDDGSGSGRIGIFSKVISGFINSSIIDMLIGHGPNAVSDFISFSAHNDFLEVLYDFGIIGELLYLRFIYLLYKVLKNLIKYKSDYAASYGFAFTIFIVLSLVSNVLFISRYGLILFTFFGMTINKARESYTFYQHKLLINKNESINTGSIQTTYTQC